MADDRDRREEEAEDEAFAPVVPLFPDASRLDHERPLTVKEPDRDNFCRHRRTELKRENRRVYCRDCGEEVPAFDVLMDLAREPDMYVENRKHLRRKVRMLRDQVAELERQERNAKSRKRRATAPITKRLAAQIESLVRTEVVLRGPITEANVEAKAERIRESALRYYDVAADPEPESVRSGEHPAA